MTPKQFVERWQELVTLAMNPMVQNAELPDNFLIADELIVMGNEIVTRTNVGNLPETMDRYSDWQENRDPEEI